MDVKVMVTTGGTNLRDDIMRIYQKGNWCWWIHELEYVIDSTATKCLMRSSYKTRTYIQPCHHYRWLHSEGAKFSFDSFNGPCFWSRLRHTPFHLMLYLTLPVPHTARFCTAASNFHGSCMWNFVYDTILMPRILRWLLGFVENSSTFPRTIDDCAALCCKQHCSASGGGDLSLLNQSQKSKAHLSETSILEHKILILVEDLCSSQFVGWSLSHTAGSVKSEASNCCFLNS
jgi:hypothetical protein